MQTILVADDSATIQRAVEIACQHEPFTLLRATSGAEALSLAQNHTPDLVLVDHMLGDQSGIVVVESLRRDPLTRAIPVLMLTNGSAPLEEGWASAHGVRGAIAKPFACHDLLERVRAALNTPGSVPRPNPLVIDASERLATAGHTGRGDDPHGATPSNLPERLPRPVPPSIGGSAAAPPVVIGGRNSAVSQAVGAAAAVAKTSAANALPASAVTKTPAAPTSSARESEGGTRSASPFAVPPGLSSPRPPPPARAGFVELGDGDISELGRPVIAPDLQPQPIRGDTIAHAVAAAIDKVGLAAPVPGVNVALSEEAKQIVERIAWQVVPDLAERIIREEIQRLLNTR